MHKRISLIICNVVHTASNRLWYRIHFQTGPILRESAYQQQPEVDAVSSVPWGPWIYDAYIISNIGMTSR